MPYAMNSAKYSNESGLCTVKCLAAVASVLQLTAPYAQSNPGGLPSL